jgi:integrase
MDEQQAVTILPDSQVSVVEDARNDLARSGAVANFYAQQTEFTRYHEKRAQNTQDRQVYDLKAFCQYLRSMGVEREATTLYHCFFLFSFYPIFIQISAPGLYDDPETWRGIEPGHIEGFIEWQRRQSFAVRAINVRLSTVRQYCTLAFKAGVIPSDVYTRIKAVKGYSYSEGIHIDEARTLQGIPTRQGRKKPEPTSISRQQVRRLKIAAVDGSKRSRKRAHDASLTERDALLVHLFTEHGFRCSEVVGLNIEHFHLDERKVRIWRSKRSKWYVYQLATGTYEALLAYLATQNRTSGPLFMGYGGKRIHRNTINARISELGIEVGITAHEASSKGTPLSPHDLRDRWAFDVIQAGNPLDQVQYYGGWESAAMPLHYAKKAGIAYGPLKLPD